MTKPLISEGLADALYEQWVHERTNAHIYLNICGYLKNKGFDNLAKHFSGQHDEEVSHSQIIFDLLTDLNTDVKIMAIPAASLSPSASIIDIATLYLEREVGTTESLDSIKDLAMGEGNPVVEERIREMITLQQKEYEEATTFSDRAELTGGDWFKVLLWDFAQGG